METSPNLFAYLQKWHFLLLLCLVTYVETYLERVNGNMNETENQRSDKLDEDLEELRLTVKEVAKHINGVPSGKCGFTTLSLFS